jgi:hypothetical protein
MAGTLRKNAMLANPFYVALMVVSTLFVVTILAWLVSAGELEDSERLVAKANHLAFASWLDRNAPLIMGIEFTIMLVTGVLAMITDDWFSGTPETVPRLQPPSGQAPTSNE